MLSWNERSIEEANLFNPAFCALLITKAAGEYKRKSELNYPFALMFLILPIVLHQQTRKLLPATTVTDLLPWIQNNKSHLIKFPARVKSLEGVTRESLIFGLQANFLLINEKGEIEVGSGFMPPTEKKTPLFTEEVRDCIERAGFIGRWFASAGTIATIYAAWGIKP